MKLSVLLSLAFCVALLGCAGKSPNLLEGQIPQGNFEEIQVEKPFDFVYLTVFDLTNGLSEWVPDKTLKNEGLIQIRNTQYSRLDDSDRRIITIRIRRDSNLLTSVFLDPDSRNVIGASDILEEIRRKLQSTN